MSFPKLIGMVGIMFMFAQYNKITKTIVSFIMVNVVDNFAFSKRSSEMFGHYISVCWNVPQRACIWMRRIAGIFITSNRVYRFSAFPVWVVFTRPISEKTPTSRGAEFRFFSASSHTQFFTVFARNCIKGIRNVESLVVNVRRCVPFVPANMFPCLTNLG